MQTNAHPPAASAIEAAFANLRVTTLTREDPERIQLRLAAETAEDCNLLYALFLRRRGDSPECHAIFSGYWELKNKRDRHVAEAKARGCLLHIGAPGAIA